MASQRLIGLLNVLAVVWIGGLGYGQGYLMMHTNRYDGVSSPRYVTISGWTANYNASWSCSYVGMSGAYRQYNLGSFPNPASEQNPDDNAPVVNWWGGTNTTTDLTVWSSGSHSYFIYLLAAANPVPVYGITLVRTNTTEGVVAWRVMDGGVEVAVTDDYGPGEVWSQEFLSTNSIPSYSVEQLWRTASGEVAGYGAEAIGTSSWGTNTSPTFVLSARDRVGPPMVQADTNGATIIKWSSAATGSGGNTAAATEGTLRQGLDGVAKAVRGMHGDFNTWSAGEVTRGNALKSTVDAIATALTLTNVAPTLGGVSGSVTGAVAAASSSVSAGSGYIPAVPAEYGSGKPSETSMVIAGVSWNISPFQDTFVTGTLAWFRYGVAWVLWFLLVGGMWREGQEALIGVAPVAPGTASTTLTWPLAWSLSLAAVVIAFALPVAILTWVSESTSAVSLAALTAPFLRASASAAGPASGAIVTAIDWLWDCLPVEVMLACVAAYVAFRTYVVAMTCAVWAVLRGMFA